MALSAPPLSMKSIGREGRLRFEGGFESGKGGGGGGRGQKTPLTRDSRPANVDPNPH